jgi:hypothetical protein
VRKPHWVVEVKMEEEMASEDVQDKRDAVKRWANYVTADEAVAATWRYRSSRCRRQGGPSVVACPGQAGWVGDPREDVAGLPAQGE